ncbi:DUF7553 family protein [Halorussus marinus]|uniref:DUF7553 family protein n=1 Tax=Halorussus marinus TaxID=2505976 RepID=UPI00106EAD9A|nr:hypothetical protein [Halorussus marinus]
MSDDDTALQRASDALTEARETTDDPAASERLATYAEQVESMAAAARGPDHGRLARFEHGLHDVREGLDAEAASLVDEALARVRAYRETVEGV